MGNTLSRQGAQFTYDSRGRMATATTIGGDVWKYGVNYRGERTLKTAPPSHVGDSRRYVYAEDGNLLSEFDGSHNWVADYFYFDGDIQAVVTSTGRLLHSNRYAVHAEPSLEYE